MEKMRFEALDMTAVNITKIAELFPGVVTEGKVNFDLLRTMLGDEVTGDEAYEFTWVGKRAAIAEAGRPIRKTLRPCVKESKNWDTTENLYIEGDNLDVLKLLQESYLGKVKMIYIDPPYNTGNDFVYKDSFAQSKDDYDEAAGVYDEDGDRLFRNTESNGRFHSDWCSMMYPRLKLARNLLSEDGAIFISIDENEVINLRKIADEIFGVANFIANIKVLSNPRGRQSSEHFAESGEYVLVYSKSDQLRIHGESLNSETIKTYNKSDEMGVYREMGLRKRGSASRREDVPTMHFPIFYDEHTNTISLDKLSNDMVEILPRLEDGSDGRWRWGKEKIRRDLSQLVVRPVRRNGRKEYDVFQKDYLGQDTTTKHKDFWIEREINYDRGAEEIRQLFVAKIFDYAKPLYLLEKIIKLASDKDSIILDFFSGSATTAHGVMQLNAEDGGKRKFIMVQLPEPCAEGTEAAKAGYKNICEIGKERIHRAGEKIKTDNAGKEGIDDLDIGFRVLKLDSTNMRDVYYAADEYTQDLLSMMEDNIKDDRTDMDLLYGCLLEWGLPLSMPHTQEKIASFTVHTCHDGDRIDLIACFDKQISDAVVKEIAKRQPLRAVFRDSSFASSPEKINVEEIFKLLAPKTSVRVI